MKNDRIFNLKDKKTLKEPLAEFFHSKWQIPKEEYLTSMNQACNHSTIIPSWYLVLDEDKIIAGAGVIENDFHQRTDLFPNVCALVVEKDYRGQGIAKKLLNHICQDMKQKGIDTLYLITDHASFYERLGWEYIGNILDNDQNEVRMYQHKEKS